ncbi:14428_t:CDS:1, partial [Dentiscutata erythropus]
EEEMDDNQVQQELEYELEDELEEYENYYSEESTIDDILEDYYMFQEKEDINPTLYLTEYLHKEIKVDQLLLNKAQRQQ